MAVATYDDLIARIGNDYVAEWPLYGEVAATTGAFGGNVFALQRNGVGQTMPSLPTGVTGYIASCVQAVAGGSTTTRVLFVSEVINLGTLDIAGPTFTDGSAMPTVTELGASNATYGPVWVEVTTALNATPGSITVTYVDQSGNAAETTAAQLLPTSNNGVGCCGWVALNSGDVGVRDITTATRTGGTTPTGVLKFWGVRPIASLITPGTGGAYYPNPMLTSSFNWARLDASSQIRCFSFTGGTTIAGCALSGSITFIGDS